MSDMESDEPSILGPEEPHGCVSTPNDESTHGVDESIHPHENSANSFGAHDGEGTLQYARMAGSDISTLAQNSDLPLDLDAASKAVSNALAGIEVLTGRPQESQPSTIDPSMPTKPRLTNRSQSLSSRALQQASLRTTQTGPGRFSRPHDPSSHWGQVMYASGIHPSLQGQHQQQYLMRLSRQQIAEGSPHGMTSYQSAPMPRLQHSLGTSLPTYQNLGGGVGSMNNFHEMQLRAQVQSLVNQPQQFGSTQQQVAWIQAQALMQQQQQSAAAQLLLQQQLQQPSQQQLQAIYTQQQQQLIQQLQHQQAQQLQMEALSGVAATGTFSNHQNQFAPLSQQQQQQQIFGLPTNTGVLMPHNHGQVGSETSVSSSMHHDLLGLYEEVSLTLITTARQQVNEELEQQIQGETALLMSIITVLTKISGNGPMASPQDDTLAIAELDFVGAVAASWHQVAGGSDRGNRTSTSPPSASYRVGMQALAHVIFRVCPFQRQELYQTALRTMTNATLRDPDLVALVAQVCSQLSSTQMNLSPAHAWETASQMLGDMCMSVVRVQQAVGGRPAPPPPPPPPPPFKNPSDGSSLPRGPPSKSFSEPLLGLQDGESAGAAQRQYFVDSWASRPGPMTTTWENPEEEEDEAARQESSSHGLSNMVTFSMNPQHHQQRQHEHFGDIMQLQDPSQQSGVGGNMFGPHRETTMHQGGGFMNSPSLVSDAFSSLDLESRARGSDSSAAASSIWSTVPQGGAPPGSLKHPNALMTVGDMAPPQGEAGSYRPYHGASAAATSPTRQSVRATTSSPMLRPPGPGSLITGSSVQGSHVPVMRAVSGSESEVFGRFSNRRGLTSEKGQEIPHGLAQERQVPEETQQKTMQFGQLW